MSQSEVALRNSRVALVAVKKYWWVIAAGTIGSVLLVLFYLKTVDPVYESNVRVLVQQRVLDLQPDAYRRQESEFITTQAEVIRSPLTITKALEKAPLTPDEQAAENPMAVILESLRINPLAGTDILKVTYSHSDPELATRRLKAIIESYQELIRERERSSSESLVELLSKRETELRKQIQDVQSRYSNLRERSPLVGKQENGVAVETDKLRDLANQLSDIQSRKLRLETLKKRLERRPESQETETSVVMTLAAEMAEFRYLQDIEQELFRARAEFDQARRIVKDRHPAYVAAQAKVETLEAEFAKKKALAVNTIQQQFATVQQEESQLLELLAQERNRVKAMDEYLLQETQIQADLARLEEVYDSTAQNLENLHLTDAALAKGRASVTVEVLDKFTLPDEPVWPQPTALLGLALVLGLGLGGVGASLLALRDGMTPSKTIDEFSHEDSSYLELKQRVQEMQELLKDINLTVDQSSKTVEKTE